MDFKKSEELCRKAGNVMDLVKPQATQDFGQVTEDVEGFTVVFSTNALKASLFQGRLSVAGDYINAKSGMKNISGMAYTGSKAEILEWIKLTLPTFVGSLKAMADT